LSPAAGVGALVAIWFWATLASGCVHWLGHRLGRCLGHPVPILAVQLALIAAAAMRLPIWAVAAAAVLCVATTALAPRSMHQQFPNRYFGFPFDWVFATGCAVRGRRFALSGASGAFGAPFKALLEARGGIVAPLKFGVDYTYDDCSRSDPALQSADVLVLAHGAKGENAMRANCDSFLALIDRFLAASKGRRVEIWAVGSEIEAHPAWGNKELQVYLESKRAYARRARRFFWDARFVYRHIVPSAFTSPMGPGLISGSLAARWAWFFISRGFRYVPVSYTGIALVNYFKFLFRVHAP
jgi:hypothetical protein